MNIKDRLTSRRKALNLTLAEVADKVGVSEATVSRWESGKIDNMKRDKIALLAKALEVSPLYIMGLDDEIPKKNSNENPTILLRAERELPQDLLEDLEAMAKRFLAKNKKK